MRWLPIFVALFGCSSNGLIATYERPAAVLLPIEVLGPVGTEEQCVLILDVRAEAEGLNLQLKLHGVSDETEAEIAINDGPLRPLTNQQLSFTEVQTRFGGIGGFSTLDATLPLLPGQLRKGANQIRFRFSGGDGTSIGFRVLAIDVVDANERSLVPAGTFTADDPASWSPPLQGTEAVEEGERLWNEATLYDVSSLGPNPLRAHCTDCHARDAADLKYFNYSNRAIIERSRFYGLTSEEGARIASYVRSLALPAPGRPWDPPYQPGPDLDDRPVDEWAAGAGQAEILASDELMGAFLFPDGINADAIAPMSTLNLRELPIALELPDWNRWLPRVHPLDSWGTDFETHELYRMYAGGSDTFGGASLTELLREGGDDYLRDRFDENQKQFTYARADFIGPLEAAAASAGWPFEDRVRIQSVHQWQMVKLWELAREYSLEDEGPLVYGASAEARTWLGGRLPNQFGLERPGTELQQAYARSTWFYLQLVLSSGNRVAAEHSVVDWIGTYRGQPPLYDLTSVAEPYRVLAMLVKGTQQATNGIGPDRPDEGWSMIRAEAGILTHPNWAPSFESLEVETRRALLEAYLSGWMDENERYPVEQYLRGDMGSAFPPADYVPEASPGSTRVDALRHMIPRLIELKVDPALVTRICVWAEAMWPLGDWETLH
jgi:hypothetical protein